MNLFLNLFRRRIPSSIEILEEMSRELLELRRSQRHCYSLRNDLWPFCGRFPRIEQVTTEQIRSYLNVRADLVGARRRDNILRSVQQLFRFARRQGYLEEGRLTAAEKIRAITAPRPEVEVWTVEEAKVLIDGVRRQCPNHLPITAISLFAGLRTCELMRLDWSAIKLDEGVIVISRFISKTRSSRAVPVQPNLAALLNEYRDRSGLLRGTLAEKTAETQHGFALSLVRRKVELPRRLNAGRHSFATYRLSQLRDFQKLAYELGNSPRMCQAHYCNPVSEAAGRAYFEIAA